MLQGDLCSILLNLNPVNPAHCMPKGSFFVLNPAQMHNPVHFCSILLNPAQWPCRAQHGTVLNPAQSCSMCSAGMLHSEFFLLLLLQSMLLQQPPAQ
jgi:hypothetical protein